MRVPVSWLKEFVNLRGISIEDLAQRLTLAGLEVEEIQYVGLPIPKGLQVTKLSGLSWDREKIVVGEIREVMPHPNADRLVLCRLFDGQVEHVVLTGAPNLFEYKGKGQLKKPLKVAYAKEGAELYDGHEPGWKKVVLKRTKIRGVESYAMACSEKELGLSEEHEGIIILENKAQAGTPLADYMGDAVLNIAITPNIARNANIYGVAREIAALFNRKLKPMPVDVEAEGSSITGKVKLEIHDPELNPRFVLGLIKEVEIRPSPDWVQRRLKLAGMRPINNIVDATNYAMLELGEPLHAFDYDALVKRAKGKPPTIVTRTAKKGENLTTLDGVQRALDSFTVLVCDTTGALSLGGVMGGTETEVTETTKNVLLEGASWNFINVRRTLNSQSVSSEAGYRFSRGVHPAMAPRGVSRGLELMRLWSGGTVNKGLVDKYPLRQKESVVEIDSSDVLRWLGVDIKLREVSSLLRRLGFTVTQSGKSLRVKSPDHRLDIGEGVIGKADLMEEIARIYGYERIPVTRLGDELPAQRGNRALEIEEKIRDLLTRLGFQEIATYRLTSPEQEARRLPPGVSPDDHSYVEIANPISSERSVLRKSLLASVLEVLETNSRLHDRQAVFEIGPVFHASESGPLPDELQRLALACSGPRELEHWQNRDRSSVNFYDMKGIVGSFLSSLGISEPKYEPAQHPAFHPSKNAKVMYADRQLGVFGELQPQVQRQYDLRGASVQIATFNMDFLLDSVPERFDSLPVPAFPPVLEDIALIIDESVPAGSVESLILESGGKLLHRVSLFDIYRGEQIGPGKKSLAYRLVYQHPERTLTDAEVAKVRKNIVDRLTRDLGAKLRE